MFKKLTAITIIITFIFICFSGCKTIENEPPVALCIVVGNYKTSKQLDLSHEILQDAIKEAIFTYGYISVISVDGNPSIEIKGTCDIDAKFKQGDASKLAAESSERAQYIQNYVKDVVADDPEVDILKSVILGADSLKEAPENSIKKMVIMCTGVSTTGLCDYRNNLIDADPVAIADALEEKRAIPDLNGVEVTWLFMGEVSSPQEDLSLSQVEKLTSIWEEIITRGGGTFTSVKSHCMDESISYDYPNVTPIEFEKEIPVQFDVSELINSDNPFSEPTFLSEEQIKFVADSDEFVEPKAAVDTIAPIADYMNRNTDFRLLLIGTTAGDGVTEYSLALSDSRADAVKNVLVTLGVSEDRILAIGMGGNDPWHIYGVGTSGELAAQNRKVVLLDASSSIARQLIQ